MNKNYLVRIISFTSIVIVFFLGACGEVKQEQEVEQGLAISEDFSGLVSYSVNKSPNDDREYRVIVLDNAMEVLLISDPDTDKSAASVDVNAGSNSDPEAFEGLAHFLEHMLFLGTAKYPEAGEYQEYIASHGGGHNAYTAYENTNYYFDIDQDYLEPALDRFSQFFIAPLFTPEYVDRERNAVHSEYQSNLQNDGRRAYAALKAVINQAHPLAQFSVGSLDTLQDKAEGSLRDALLAHYDRYYSANLMRGAILGSESLDELEAMAVLYFSGIENRNRQAPATQEPLFNPNQLPAMLEILPVRDSRSLTFTFPIPVVREHYKSKPLNYLGNVLGHEGEGSLLSLLKAKGWANGLSAGGGFSYADNATFTISVSLTEEGVDQINAISHLVFQFIGLVEQQGLHEWLFDEQRTLAELSFRFQEPARPISYVSSMSRRLQQYPPEELITAGYAYEQYDENLLRSILAELRPDNVLLTFTSQDVEPDQTEPWFGGQYRYSSLPDSRVGDWDVSLAEPADSALAIARPNPFLPEDLEIKPFVGPAQPAGVPSVNVKPALIVDEGGSRLWFKQDNEFQTPRANFYVYAMTDLFSESLENTLLSSFVMSLVNDKLSEYSYPANLAGVYYGVSRRSRGFTLNVGGYEDKQAILLETLLDTLVAADFAAERFEIIKTEMIRGWENASVQMPYVRLFQEAQALLINPYWSEEQRIEAVADITLDDVKAFVPRMLENLRIDALYHGNVLEEDALAMLDIVDDYLQSSADIRAPEFGTVVNLADNIRVVQDIEVEHDDSAIVIYMQGPDDTLETRATISLLGTILRTPFYDTLRTEQQLGYIVNAGTLPILKTNGLVFYIESPSADPVSLENSINTFLAEYAEELAAMPAEAFDDIKAGLLNNMRQPPQRLNALIGRYWSDILIQEYETDSSLLMADTIEGLDQQDVLAYYQEHVASPETGRLVARSAGTSFKQVLADKRTETAGSIFVEKTVASYQEFKAAAEKFVFE